ncbi:MAG: phosphoesterase [Candidatus Eremiobacteraeota bacterium]|nr:phosphoesterase [Candidatus Eremiobacteraeota bacterium]
MRALVSRLVVALMLLAAVGASPVPETPSASGGPYGVNLVRNGGAEDDAGISDPNGTTHPAWWTAVGTTPFALVFLYGAAGGYPTAATPGSPRRGKNFFYAGNVQRAQAAQDVMLPDAAATDIDRGRATYTLSAWLGGYGGQHDNATVTLVFLSAAGGVIGSPETVGPVTAAERKNVTAFLRRAAPARVPAGARTARIVMTMLRTDGSSNDGYVDDVSLVLGRAP